MNRTTSALSTTVIVTVWSDPVIETTGFPVDDPYTEAVWCSILGPTSLLVLRRLATAAVSNPSGQPVDVGDLATTLGVSTAVATKALSRLVRFGFAAPGTGTLRVRTHVSPIPERFMARVSASGRHHHLRAMGQRTPP